MSKTHNFLSENNTRVRNQYITFNEKGDELFTSYSTDIALWVGGKMFLSPYWDCSRTTSKYCYQFLRKHGFNVHRRIDVERLIESKEIGMKSHYSMSV